MDGGGRGILIEKYCFRSLRLQILHHPSLTTFLQFLDSLFANYVLFQTTLFCNFWTAFLQTMTCFRQLLSFGITICKRLFHITVWNRRCFWKTNNLDDHLNPIPSVELNQLGRHQKTFGNLQRTKRNLEKTGK